VAISMLHETVSTENWTVANRMLH